MLNNIKNKILNGKRISPKELLQIFNYPLLEVGKLANYLRFKKNPNKTVTFVIDTNPNYTNICIDKCLFCAFYRPFKTKDAYTLSVKEVLQKIEDAVNSGATTILLQGGHNPEIDFDYYLTIIKQTRKRFPDVTPHFFSAPEILFFAKNFKMSIHKVLSELKKAGQFTLPGGGAEILSENIRKKISPKKCSVSQWIEVHKTAHKLGFKSTATMMYGHIETPKDIVEHLTHIRNLQDETNGFTAFIPWSFKPENSVLGRKIKTKADGCMYLRIIALSRIFLDNFQHIQASWFSEGKKVGEVALHFGADDFGGVLLEENVHKAANFYNASNIDEVKKIIKDAGFIPIQRTTLY